MSYRYLIEQLTFLYFFILSVEAPLRYYLNSVGLHWVIYSKDLILIFIISSYLLLVADFKRFPLRIFILLIIGVFYVLYSFIEVGNILQVIFGIKVLLPMLTVIVAWDTLKKITNLVIVQRSVFLFLITLFGLLIDIEMDLPWQGLEIETAGFDVAASREWTTFGITRLSGFTRSSFNAAQLLLLFYIIIINYLIQSQRSKWLILVVFLSGLFGISITTTKGIILSFILTNIFLFVYKWKFLRITSFVGVVVTMCALPIFGVFYLSSVNLQNQLLMRLIFQSLLTRMEVVWPKGFELVTNGNIILGRGIGGIGTSQWFFESERYNPADNLFIYLFVSFGLLGVLYFMIRWISISRTNRLLTSLVFAMLVYGFTTGVMESYFSFILGICLVSKK